MFFTFFKIVQMVPKRAPHHIYSIFIGDIGDRSSHRRCSIKKVFLVISQNFAKFLRTLFLQNTSGQLLLWGDNILILFLRNIKLYNPMEHLMSDVTTKDGFDGVQVIPFLSLKKLICSYLLTNFSLVVL